MNSNNLIINGDDKYLKKLKCYKCGINSNNDLIAYNIYEEYANYKIDVQDRKKDLSNFTGARELKLVEIIDKNKIRRLFCFYKLQQFG